MWSRLNFALLGVAVLLSTGSALQGVYYTWADSQPLVYLKSSPTPPFVGVELGCPSGVSLRRCVTCPRWDFNGAGPRYGTPKVEHSLNANFGDELMLLGYDLPSRRVQAGEALPITLYWQSLHRTERSYVLFSRLLDSSATKRGGLDRRPAGTNTACWEAGEVVEDHFEVPAYAQAGPGVYTLQLGLYTGPAATAHYVPLVRDGHPLDEAQVTIGPIKVTGAPAGTTLTSAAPQHVVGANLGPVIRLVGYDLEQSAHTASLVLYWTSVAPTDVDYTAFVHLTAADGQLAAQVDGPPAQGAYPTSLWEPGEIIPDRLSLPLAGTLPAGRYDLAVGLYDLATGTRLDVTGSSDNAIHLRPVTIEPR